MENKNNNRILVIGLGNPILGDDGLGWHVVEKIEKVFQTKYQKIAELLNFEYYSLGGLSLMENMEGYYSVLIVDSIITGNNPIGTIFSLPFERLPDFSSGHSTAAHDTSLRTALEFGKKCGISLPETIWVVAIEAEIIYQFSSELSKPIKEAIPTTAKLVIEMLLKNKWVECEISEATI